MSDVPEEIQKIWGKHQTEVNEILIASDAAVEASEAILCYRCKHAKNTLQGRSAAMRKIVDLLVAAKEFEILNSRKLDYDKPTQMGLAAIENELLALRNAYGDPTTLCLLDMTRTAETACNQYARG